MDSESRKTTTDGGSMPAIEVVGRHMKELVNSLNRLEQLGVERYDLPLPKIVVVGDQSAGKSSLIEAISEIKVPRSSGTCTRCPLQINLIANDEPNAIWSCQVTLDKKYHYIGEGYSKEDPWMINEDTKTEFPFKTVRDKDELERVLHWAQIATLNPGKNHLQYVSADELGLAESLQVKFSPNVVRLDISGPNLPYLSFYDLPGVISQAESAKDKHLVRLVKRLVENYIKSSNTIVLLTCSMEGDVANSTASMIVREMNATDRCIGVLTKPDRLPPDDPIDTWRDILEGNIFEVGHSYYVTKQPSQSYLNKLSHEQARLQEAKFFESTEPWNTELSDFRDRFGTPRLQKILSQTLTEKILASVPVIKSQIETKITHLDDQLNKMPSPPRDSAILTISDYIGRFCDQVAKDMEGEPPHNSFKNRWKQKISSFQTDMVKLKPILLKAKSELHPVTSDAAGDAYITPRSTPKKSSPIKKDVDNADIVSLLSEGESSPTPKRRKVETTPTPTPRKSNRARPKGPTCGSSSGNGFSVDEIRRLVTAVSTCDVPGRLDPRAVDHIIKKTVAIWNKPVSKFVHDFTTLLRTHLRSTLQDKFAVWRSTDFFRQSTQVVDVFVMKLTDELSHYAEYVLRVEQFKPITSDISLAKKNGDETQRLESERFTSRAHEYFDMQDELSSNSTGAPERRKQIERDGGKALKDKLGPDMFANEVRMLAETRAYYDIASVRLVDNLWMNIRADILEKCRTGLLEELKTGLNLYANNANATFSYVMNGAVHEYCIQLLAEDPAREIRRRQLKQERETLFKAQMEVRELEEKFAIRAEQ